MQPAVPIVTLSNCVVDLLKLQPSKPSNDQCIEPWNAQGVDTPPLVLGTINELVPDGILLSVPPGCDTGTRYLIMLFAPKVRLPAPQNPCACIRSSGSLGEQVTDTSYLTTMYEVTSLSQHRILKATNIQRASHPARHITSIRSELEIRSTDHFITLSH